MTASDAILCSGTELATDAVNDSESKVRRLIDLLWPRWAARLMATAVPVYVYSHDCCTKGPFDK